LLVIIGLKAIARRPDIVVLDEPKDHGTVREGMLEPLPAQPSSQESLYWMGAELTWQERNGQRQYAFSNPLGA
jgi:hypothetical protein